MSALLVVYTRDINYTYIGVIIPLLLILDFTFKIPMARVEDANRHLQKVNSLYLSTIETLAMAWTQRTKLHTAIFDESRTTPSLWRKRWE